ncbi:hypothetical protein ABKN59_004638 [Abortiporus biennis]
MSKTEKTDSSFPARPASRARVVTISRRGYGFRIRPNPTLESKAEKAYVPFEEGCLLIKCLGLDVGHNLVTVPGCLYV